MNEDAKQGMLDLANSLYCEAEMHRSSHPDIAERMVDEADDIIKQFAPPPVIEEPEPVVEEKPEIEEDLQNLLAMMREAKTPKEEPSDPRKKFWDLSRGVS